VLLGGACDALDGQVARATNAGTQFGEELDSLVDAITFGLAPGLIMYFAVFNQASWDWLSVFLFSACAVMRLARFNIEQAGTAKTYFQGLPSPAAGITLASYYWFSQSWLYSYGAIGDLPWQELLRFLMAALAFLMISNIPYPVVPRVGFRSLRAIGASILVFGSLALLATKRLEFFFPLCIGYVAFGLARSLFFRLFERRQPTVPYDLSEGEDDEEEDEEFEPGSSQVHANRQGHREPRPVREDRSKRTRVASEVKVAAPAVEERTPRPPRGERPERPERPQRTEAERAARKEKREKRDKRGERGARPVSPERTTDVVPFDAGADAPVLTESPAPARDGVDEVIGVIPGASESGAASRPEGAPARKRKRRRRRGERGSRPGSEGVEAGEGSDANDGPEGDDGSYDAGPDEGSASYAADAPVSSSPPASRAERDEYAGPPSRVSPLSPPVQPAPTPAPAPAPPSAPSPSSDSPE
jgi:CDP-diacylglycerol---serine O-phosphatidyltransferase